MANNCKAEGCTRPIFSHLYCSYHQYMRRLRGGDLYERKTPNKKQKPIPKKSKKRIEDEQSYKQIKDELRAEMRANGTYNCIFCNKPMGNELSFHHLKGRIGKDLTDRKYLQPAHGECHIEKYHQATVEQLLKQEWYQGFLERIKAIDPILYNKEKNKAIKSELSFEDSLF